MAKRTYNRRGRQTAKTPVTSSARRQQRIKGAQTARKTGSKDKMTVSGQRNIKGGPRGAQGPANPPQQGPSRRVTTAIGGDTGRRIPQNKYGTKGTPRSGPPGLGKTPRFNPKVRRPNASPTALAQMTGAYIAGKMAETIGKPGQSKMSGLGIDPNRLPKGENPPKSKKPMASMGKSYKSQEKGLSRKAAASNFDRAFAAARKAGKKTFIWRGKKYTTKMK